MTVGIIAMTCGDSALLLSVWEAGDVDFVAKEAGP